MTGLPFSRNERKLLLCLLRFYREFGPGATPALKGLDEEIFRHFTLKLNLFGTGRELGPEAIHERIVTEVKTLLRNKETEYGKPMMGYLMKVIMLQSIDT